MKASQLVICLFIVSTFSCTKKADVKPATAATPSKLALVPSASRSASSNGTNLWGNPRLQGYNWADERDNFQSGTLLLSGIVATDNYAAILNKAIGLYDKLIAAGVNTVRIPINYSTVTTADYWDNYKAVIDAALTRAGVFNVIICYWPDGKGADIPYGTVDEDKWKAAWTIVTTAYIERTRVYYEPINEPWGYGNAAYPGKLESDLLNLYNTWLTTQKITDAATQHRVILAGLGVEENVVGVGNDSRFNNCLLGYHMYSFVYDMQNGGSKDIEPTAALRRRTDWPIFFSSYNQIGQYANRTVITEFGSEQNESSMDYNNHNGYDNSWGGEKIPCFQGLCNFAFTENVPGLIYWPGCKKDDKYAMFTGDCNNTNIPTPQNTSALTVLQAAWTVNSTNTWDPVSPNYSANGTYVIKTVQTANMALGNRSNWGSVGPYVAGNTNQQWHIIPDNKGYYYLQCLDGNNNLDVQGANSTAGTAVDLYSPNQQDNQRWSIQQDCMTGNIYIQSVQSKQSLNVRGNATAGQWNDCVIWPFDYGANSMWTIIKVS